jgi:threonine dehydrogenase-like Zn-dependent dehydrogenase
VLVETIACGICGSDLHIQRDFDKLVAGAAAMGNNFMFDVERDVVMGHEFSGRVIELGEGVTNLREGDVVVGVPLMLAPEGPAAVGYSADYPGGYGERMLLTAALCYKVPDHLDARHAALTEPMGIGIRGVGRANVTAGESAIVTGCGPIGLGVIAALRLAGAEPIVASDPSPKRRTLARHMGANEVVDPAAEAPLDVWKRVAGSRSLLTVEASGVRGMLAQAMHYAPRNGRVLVVGVCTEPDVIYPMLGIEKELSVVFSLGSQPDEFERTLQLIANGDIDVGPLITGEIGIAGVPQAFVELQNPQDHAKILVEPALG